MAITTLFVDVGGDRAALTLPLPFAYWFDPIILEFCFGMAIALAYRAGLRLSPAFVWLLILAAIAAFAATTVWGASAPWRALAWGAPSAAIVAALVLSSRVAPAGPVGRVFGFLGDASYSIYLTHPLVFPVVGWILPRWIDFSAEPCRGPMR